MKDIRRKLLAVFRIEYKDHLDFIRKALAPVRTGEGTVALPVDEVFRRAHSLKGAARATDLRPIETLAHRLETLFARVRTGELALDQPLAALVLRVADAIEDWVAGYDGQIEPPAPDEALRLLDGALGEAPSASPPAEAAVPPAVAIAAAALVAPDDAATLRIQAASLDHLLRSAERLQGEAQRYHILGPTLRALEDGLADLDREWKALVGEMSQFRSQAAEQPGGMAVGRRADAISRGLRLLGNEARGMRLRHRHTSWALGRICDNLHTGVRLVRMVPANDIFGGFRKMMRDLARDVGKEAGFDMVGGEVEADRAVLQALKDPVMHILRNALFHGVEPAARRVAKGKPAEARISLAFERHGSHLAVRVEDDGAGVDVARIAARVVRAGLLSPAEAAAAGDEVVRFIFHPGFSTAEDVNDLAGRGMGLSVAHEAVRRLNGALEVMPRDGGGTVFRMTVPISVSAQRLLMVGCRDEVYGIPTVAIERLLRVREADIVSIEGMAALAFDGRHIHLRSLAGLLGLADAGVSTLNGMLEVVVLRWEDTSIGIAVDALHAMSNALIKDLGFALPGDSKVGGGVLLDNGGIALVLNPYELVRAFLRRGAPPPLVTTEQTAAPAAPVIMVVDDSMTTRTLEKSILEAHGYRVLVAVDGLDALLQLRANPVDLVVADVEMPRIDGFTLLKELKRDTDLRRIPVILVTSLRRTEDLERGFALGAEAYLTKQKFDQRELLDTIKQIL